MTPEDIQQIRELIAAASTGVEHGCVIGKIVEEHANDLRNSMRADTAVGTDLHGVYLAGSETVVCHTGNGPRSAANARLITFALNNMGKLIDEIERLQPRSQIQRALEGIRAAQETRAHPFFQQEPAVPGPLPSADLLKQETCACTPGDAFACSKANPGSGCVCDCHEQETSSAPRMAEPPQDWNPMKRFGSFVKLRRGLEQRIMHEHANNYADCDWEGDRATCRECGETITAQF